MIRSNPPNRKPQHRGLQIARDWCAGFLVGWPLWGHGISLGLRSVGSGEGTWAYAPTDKGMTLYLDETVGDGRWRTGLDLGELSDGEMSIVALFRTRDLDDAGDTDCRQRVIGKGSTGTVWGWGIGYNGSGDANEMWFTQADVSDWRSSTVTLIENHWHIGGLTVTGGDIYHYLDGSAVGSNLSTAVTLSSDTSEVVLGDWERFTGEEFRGDIGCVFVWHRALTAAEHARLGRNIFLAFEPLTRWYVSTGSAVPPTGLCRITGT